MSVEVDSKSPALRKPEATIGTILLIFSLAAAILHLPSFRLLSTESIFVRIAWRYIVLFLMFAPKMAYDSYNNVFNFVDGIIEHAGPVFGLSLLNLTYVYMLYFAVLHTFVAHTLLLGSIPTTFYAVWKIASKQPFTRLEYIGIGINVFGAYLCCCEGAPLASNSFLLSNFL